MPSFIMVVISIPSLGQQMLLDPYKYRLPFVEGSFFDSDFDGDDCGVGGPPAAEEDESPFFSVVTLASSVWLGKRKCKNQ